MTCDRYDEINALVGDLPIGDVLAGLRAALRRRHELVLEAPPGAGKTTIVPLALRHEPWLGEQKIVMLEPRRVAARACAARMAQLLGEPLGRTVGYSVRLESQVSDATRIEVVTEGVLTRRLLSDPALDGVGLLIFDEFHERSLEADLGLGLALLARELFRDAAAPLKLLVMSATLDGAAISALLGDAPRIRAEGRLFPVTLHYDDVAGRSGAGRRGGQAGACGDGSAQRAVAQCVDRVCRVLTEPSAADPAGQGVLVFLPGQAEIRRAMRELEERLPQSMLQQVDILPLYGALSLAQQQLAMRASEAGRRKVVLATNIAQTSLTIEGVATVIDSGLARTALFDPGTGTTRLHTAPISRACSEQRAGRAGRLGPGRCYRLWAEERQGRLGPCAAPEILQADLAPLALQLLAWGVGDPSELAWLDPPPRPAWEQAMHLLSRLQAVRASGGGTWQLTALGSAMAALPLHPRLAHMLVRARAAGLGALACELAAVLSERDPLQGEDIDIARRLGLLRRDRDPAHRDWRRRVAQLARQYQRLLCQVSVPDALHWPAPPDEQDAVGCLLALAYPDRIARRRHVGSDSCQLANGRAVLLPDSGAVNGEPWFVVADLGGRAGRAEDRAYLAAPLAPRLFESALAELVATESLAFWDEERGRFVAERRRMVGRLVLARQPSRDVDPACRRQALVAYIARRGLELLPWTPELRQWCARVALLRRLELPAPGLTAWPDLDDDALREDLDHWLGPWLEPVSSLDRLGGLDLAAILGAQLPWEAQQALNALAPTHWRVPSGARVAIDYLCDPPVLAVKLQEMFGSDQTPVIAGGRVILTLHLLSPARRPLQITQDLGGFWRGSYAAVKKEMKGRYPKHPWPDDPLQALPTARARRRGSGGDSAV